MTPLFCKKTGIVVILTLIFALFAPPSVNAEDLSADDLNAAIAAKTDAIKTLESQIADYQTQLKAIGSQKQSLQNEIKALDITSRKLAADISVTETKISRTDLELQELSSQINIKSGELDINRNALKMSLRQLNQSDSYNMVETLLSSQTISTAWDTIETAQKFEESVKNNILLISQAKQDLQSKKDSTAKIMNQLTNLRNQLADQKKIADYNTKQKNDLLKATKNNEANYTKILKQKMAMRDAFEQELLDYESQLHLLIDPKSYPIPRHGILSWPLQNISVTQYFGNTSFSNSNPSVYNGQGHNGVDFRASVGTPITAALEGDVVGTGDTDTVCPGASYGKWVLIAHSNGLSTLYAHLSVMRVGKGNHVGTGELIGYSGNTGYTTGPHLHLGLFATQGMQVMDHKSKVCGGTYTMPIADLKAYLDPLLYLPALN